MHRLISTLQLKTGEEIICYADDICIKALTPARMQHILNEFTSKAAECGLVISVEKTQALRQQQTNTPPRTRTNTPRQKQTNTKRRTQANKPRTRQQQTNKTRQKRANTPRPIYQISNTVIGTCDQYNYLGVNVNDPDMITKLRERLKERLKPLRTLTGKHYGINIRLAKMFYVSFVRSVIDYHALCLLPYLSTKKLDPLEKVQNEAM